MGQQNALAAMDQAIHGALAGAGLADTGSYHYDRDGTRVHAPHVQLYVDRDSEIKDEHGLVIGRRIEVQVVHQAGWQPQQHGRITVDGDTLELGKRIDGDGSISSWVARRV